ncbi:hypothetical protein ACFO0A_00805 [Novosphingobium tardum]|uniref:Uncharacterized protein n=1 Tax=Novosphingobium tardum TaxID=1538021 RepID=A0ABV8RM60_9SPHN
MGRASRFSAVIVWHSPGLAMAVPVITLPGATWPALEHRNDGSRRDR